MLIDEKPVDIDGDRGIWTSAANEGMCLSIDIRNVGDGPACRLRLRDDSAFGKASAMDQHRLCVPQDGVYKCEASLANLRDAGAILLIFRYENILGCPFSQQTDIQIACNPIYDEELSGIDDGVSGHEIVDQNFEMSVTSLSAQIVEKPD